MKKATITQWVMFTLLALQCTRILGTKKACSTSALRDRVAMCDAAFLPNSTNSKVYKLLKFWYLINFKIPSPTMKV